MRGVVSGFEKRFSPNGTAVWEGGQKIFLTPEV
jgi:hypothetical protein